MTRPFLSVNLKSDTVFIRTIAKTKIPGSTAVVKNIPTSKNNFTVVGYTARYVKPSAIKTP